MSQLPTPEQQAESEWLAARFGHLPVIRNVLFELGGPMPMDFATETDGGNVFVYPRYTPQDDLMGAFRSKTATRFRSSEEANTFNAAIMRILQNMMARTAKGR